METNVEIKIKNHKDFLSLENDKHGTVQISLEDRKVWGMYVPKKLNSIIEWEKKTKQNKTKKAKETFVTYFRGGKKIFKLIEMLQLMCKQMMSWSSS